MASTTIVRRGPPSWWFTSETDLTEAEHRVDLLNGTLYCTCAGFLYRKWCGHLDQIRNEMEDNGMAIAVATPQTGLQVWRSPEEMRRRMADLLEERSLVQQFFKEVMVPSTGDKADGDYGLAPGTDRPTLFKAGAEKLCELYGYAIEIADVQEFKDDHSGHYRAVVRVTLLSRSSGSKVADGIGECNTRESRYFYRWVFERDVPTGVDKSRLKQRSGTARNGRAYTLYRVENDELHSLWNTILKMAKKRALVDATLSATRSSGIFSQGAAHFDEWIDADYEFHDEPDVPDEPPPVPESPPTQQPRQQSQPASQQQRAPAQKGQPQARAEDVMTVFWMETRRLKKDTPAVSALSKEMFEGKEPAQLTPQERTQLLHRLEHGEPQQEPVSASPGPSVVEPEAGKPAAAPPEPVTPEDHQAETGHDDVKFSSNGETMLCGVCQAELLQVPFE